MKSKTHAFGRLLKDPIAPLALPKIGQLQYEPQFTAACSYGRGPRGPSKRLSVPKLASQESGIFGNLCRLRTGGFVWLTLISLP